MTPHLYHYYCARCSLVQESQIKPLAETEKDLQERQKIMALQIHDDHEDIVQERKLINNYTAEMKQYLNNWVETSIQHDKMISANEVDFRFRLHSLGLINSLQSKLIHQISLQQIWVQTIDDCRSGRLPHLILEENDLKEDLNRLNKIVQKENFELTIPPREVKSYFSLTTTTCSFSNFTLTMSIQVPIKTLNTEYRLVEIGSYPFLVDNKICSVRLDESFAIVRNNHSLIMLSDEAGKRCTNAKNNLCHTLPFSTFYSHNYNCIKQALNGNDDILKTRKNCVLTCTAANLEKPVITYIRPNTFGILFPNKTIRIEHPKQSTSYLRTSENEFGITVLRLACQARAFVGNKTIFSEYPCRGNETTTIHHELPKQFSTAKEERRLNNHDWEHQTPAGKIKTWKNEIPILDLSEPHKEYELPEHVKHASFISFGTVFVCLIIIIAIILLAWKGRTLIATLISLMNPTTIALSVIEYLRGRIPIANAAPTDDCKNTFPGPHDVIIAIITITVLILGLQLLLIALTCKLQRKRCNFNTPTTLPRFMTSTFRPNQENAYAIQQHRALLQEVARKAKVKLEETAF